MYFLVAYGLFAFLDNSFTFFLSFVNTSKSLGNGESKAGLKLIGTSSIH